MNMHLSRSSFIQLFKDCQVPYSNKPSILHLCKKLKIEYPYTADEMPSYPLLGTVRVASRPNGHDYPIGSIVMLLLRQTDMTGKKLTCGPSPDCTCKGICVHGDSIVLGNWLPTYPSIVSVPIKTFLDTVPETPVKLGGGANLIKTRANNGRHGEFMGEILTRYQAKAARA